MYTVISDPPFINNKHTNIPDANLSGTATGRSATTRQHPDPAAEALQLLAPLGGGLAQLRGGGGLLGSPGGLLGPLDLLVQPAEGSQEFPAAANTAAPSQPPPMHLSLPQVTVLPQGDLPDLGGLGDVGDLGDLGDIGGLGDIGDLGGPAPATTTNLGRKNDTPDHRTKKPTFSRLEVGFQ